MKDPGPNPIELLHALLLKSGPLASGSPGAYGANPLIWPGLFYWKGDPQHHMAQDGDGDYSIGIEQDEGHALAGHRNIQMTTRETTPTSSDKVWLTKSLALPATAFLRLQLAFGCPYTNTARSYEFYLDHYDGTYLYTAQWRCTTGAPLDPICQYKHPTTGWTVITGWTWLADDLHWNTIDICANIAEHKNHALTINHQSTDLSHQAFGAAASTENPHLQLQIWLKNLEAAKHTLYLDHILLTPEKVEPA